MGRIADMDVSSPRKRGLKARAVDDSSNSCPDAPCVGKEDYPLLHKIRRHRKIIGDYAMTRRDRSFFLMPLLATFGLVSVLAFVGAQEAKAQTSQQSLWSDPATWPNHKVPVAGDKVTIGRDKDVVLDVSPPALNGLSIDGKLSFADNADLELTTEWIMLHRELAIGSEAKPYTHKATITLTDNIKDEDVMGGMGDRGIMLSGGTLNLHGSTTNTWTKLAKTAAAGG